jgi:helicase
MRPERSAQRLLSITRSKAKMYEYDVPEEYHIALPQRPEILFSLAVGLLGDAAASIATDVIEGRREVTPPEALKFSGIYFDAYLQSRLSNVGEHEFPILAAASYYLADNPGSAKVLITRTGPPPPQVGSGLALLTYRLLGSDYSAVPTAPYANIANSLLAQLAAYLNGEGDAAEVILMAGAIRSEAYVSGDGRELLYADVVAAVVRKKISNSAAAILPEASGIGIEVWRSYLPRPHFPRELWPSQQRICAARVLRGESCVIQMPTSAGKTRATELILRSGFLSDRVSLAVVVCPFRSLCHDIRGDMSRAFAEDNVALNEATDSFQQDLSIDELLARKTILIVTPEKLLYLLRRTPELADQIGLVVYDEGHQFDSGARGVTYELLLTSLKLLLAGETQVILISAVIANAPRVAGWLIGNEEAIVDGAGLLPTVRSVAFASWRDRLGRLEYVSPLDPDDIEFFVPRVIERVELSLVGRETARRYFPTAEDGTSVGLYLGLKLVPSGSVAIFCGRKDTAVNLCASAVDVFRRTAAFDGPSEVSNEDEVAKLVALFSRHLGSSAPTTEAATLGIFPHHASVPHGLRLAIEFVMKESLIHFVICTSTLAQGVNLPIRYLIVTGVYQGGDKILVRDFHNLIGRAGRAGMHTEATIIFTDTKVFDKKRHRRESWRWRTAKELLDLANSEPSGSSISAIFQPFYFGQPTRTISLDVERLHNLVFDDEDGVEGTVQRVTAANPGVDQVRFRRFLQERVRVVHGIASFLLAHLDFAGDGMAERAVELARNTFAHYLANENQRVQIEALFQNVAERLLEGAPTEEARATLRRSPLAPTSVNRLRSWLSDNSTALLQAAQAGTLLATLTPVVLQHNKSPATLALSDRAILAEVIQAWIDGSPFATIHSILTASDVRIGGNRRRPIVEDAVALCEGALGYEGAMILATIADLAEDANDGLSNSISFLQRQMKAGLPSEAACGFFEAGFADRVVAQSLAEAFPQVSDRQSARAVIRQRNQQARAILNEFPAYFENVIDELSV